MLNGMTLPHALGPCVHGAWLTHGKGSIPDVRCRSGRGRFGRSRLREARKKGRHRRSIRGWVCHRAGRMGAVQGNQLFGWLGRRKERLGLTERDQRIVATMEQQHRRGNASDPVK